MPTTACWVIGWRMSTALPAEPRPTSRTTWVRVRVRVRARVRVRVRARVRVRVRVRVRDLPRGACGLRKGVNANSELRWQFRAGSQASTEYGSVL